MGKDQQLHGYKFSADIIAVCTGGIKSAFLPPACREAPGTDADIGLPPG
jgi:hypothetical protein